MRVPYRVRTRWFVTPDARLEAVSELLEDDRQGTVEGELRFHYPGHRGQPAFRGVAEIKGTTTACNPGFQIAEWKHVRWDPDTGTVHSWWWEGVLKLNLRWGMLVNMTFGEVEVFQ